MEWIRFFYSIFCGLVGTLFWVGFALPFNKYVFLIAFPIFTICFYKLFEPKEKDANLGLDEKEKNQ